jgi:hypothetical protein
MHRNEYAAVYARVCTAANSSVSFVVSGDEQPEVTNASKPAGTIIHIRIRVSPRSAHVGCHLWLMSSIGRLIGY